MLHGSPPGAGRGSRCGGGCRRGWSRRRQRCSPRTTSRSRLPPRGRCRRWHRRRRPMPRRRPSSTTQVASSVRHECSDATGGGGAYYPDDNTPPQCGARPTGAPVYSIEEGPIDGPLRRSGRVPATDAMRVRRCSTFDLAPVGEATTDGIRHPARIVGTVTKSRSQRTSATSTASARWTSTATTRPRPETAGAAAPSIRRPRRPSRARLPRGGRPAEPRATPHVASRCCPARIVFPEPLRRRGVDLPSV